MKWCVCVCVFFHQNQVQLVSTMLCITINQSIMCSGSDYIYFYRSYFLMLLGCGSCYGVTDWDEKFYENVRLLQQGTFLNCSLEVIKLWKTVHLLLQFDLLLSTTHRHFKLAPRRTAVRFIKSQHRQNRSHL